jgi:hypothetical protein
MNPSQLLVCSFVLGILIVIIGSSVNYFYNQKKFVPLELTSFINLMLSAGSIVSACNLIYRLFIEKEIHILLGADTGALILGAIALIWVSAQSIRQIFANALTKSITSSNKKP